MGCGDVAVEDEIVDPETPVEPDSPSPETNKDSETSLFVLTREPLNLPPDIAKEDTLWMLTVEKNGGWTVKEQQHPSSGTLDATQLASIQEKLGAAEIMVRELGEGEARCMAMPMVQMRLQAKSKTVEWQHPCGAPVPSDSMSELVRMVEQQTWQSKPNGVPTAPPASPTEPKGGSASE